MKVAERAEHAARPAVPDDGPVAARRARPRRPRSFALVLGTTGGLLVGALAATAVLRFALPATRQTSSLPPPAANTHLARPLAPGQIIAMPYVFPTKRVDYLYMSGLGTPHVPVYTFKVLGHWLTKGEAMPQFPPWVDASIPMESGPIWSPAVIKIGDHYVMWFTAPWDNPIPYHGQRHPKCIGYATSSSPEGPFANPSALRPALCQVSEHGDIDPQPVNIGGQWWLYFKSDNNSDPAAPHTKIWVQRLAPNGTTLEGQPVMIYENNLPWEGQIVESPQMVVHKGHYYMFFSGNSAWASNAGIGLAVCAGPTGPCRSPYKGPFLGSNLLGAGPSEVRVFTQRGVTWLLYTPEATYYPGELPHLAVSRVAFGPGGPYVAAFDGAKPGV